MLTFHFSGWSFFFKLTWLVLFRFTFRIYLRYWEVMIVKFIIRLIKHTVVKHMHFVVNKCDG